MQASMRMNVTGQNSIVSLFSKEDLEKFPSLVSMIESILKFDRYDSSSEKYLQHALDFSAILSTVDSTGKSNVDLLFERTNDPALLFRKIVLYFHPDKYPQQYSNISEPTLQTFSSTFVKIKEARLKRIELESELKEEERFSKMREFVKEASVSVSLAEKERMEAVDLLERKCYEIIRAHIRYLPQETGLSLLRIYGSIVSYAVNWSAEYNQAWLLEAGNMNRLGKNIAAIQPVIQQYRLQEEFAIALKIASNVGRENSSSLLAGLAESCIVDQNTREQEAKAAERADKTGTLASIVVTLGLTAFFASNPIGWGLAAACIGISTAKAGVNHLSRQSAAQDRLNFYNDLFKIHKENFKEILPFVKASIEYMQEMQKNLPRIAESKRQLQEYRRIYFGISPKMPVVSALVAEEIERLRVLGFDEKDFSSEKSDDLRRCLKMNTNKQRFIRVRKLMTPSNVTTTYSEPESNHFLLMPPPLSSNSSEGKKPGSLANQPHEKPVTFRVTQGS